MSKEKEEPQPTFVEAIWFCPCKENDKDFLAKLQIVEGKWELEYRFRYYKDSKAFDSKDEKHWYKSVGPDASDEARDTALKAMDTLKPVIEAKFGMKMDVVVMQCAPTDPKFFFELSSQSWANVKMIKKEKA